MSAPALPEQAPDRVLADILGHAGIEVSVTAKPAPDRLVLEVAGPDSGLVIGKQGTTLDALQYLVNKIVYRDVPGQAPVVVDAEGYRARRAESLIGLAKRLAEDAKRSGRRIQMAPMSPADRRIVHMAISEIEGVTTQSEGEGPNRRLVIIPERDLDDPGDDEAL